ncbi:MAG: hypothetical protein KF724_08875 [Phycisphaeraceae bacterium]|nr:hypothetical protein [Phycisphaeraceae bacterium]
MALALAVAALGCDRAKILNPSPGDALRAENLQLRDEVQRLTQQTRELETRLEESRRSASASGQTAVPSAARMLDPEEDAALPRLASVQIEGTSEVILGGSGGGQVPATLRLRILPLDGRGRFMQIVGRLTVSAACVRAGSAPEEVMRAVIGPGAIRDGWRSSFMGTGYAFEIPLQLSGSLRECPLTISIRFDDALSGRAFEDQRRIAPGRTLTATIPPLHE